MSELTREKKCQIAALAAKGKSAEEIAEIAKVEIEAVKALLATRGTEKNVDDMSMQEKKDYAVRLYHQGKTRKEIMGITGLSQSAVYLLIPASKGDQKGKPHKKKEPAPAATDTSSNAKNEIKTLSTNNDTTETAESQALKAAKKKLLEIYETLSPEETRAWEMGEVYAEIVRGCGNESH